MAIIAADGHYDPLVERYLNHLRVEGGLSRNTIEAYRRDLDQISSVIFINRASVPVQQLRPTRSADFSGRFMRRSCRTCPQLAVCRLSGDGSDFSGKNGLSTTTPLSMLRRDAVGFDCPKRYRSAKSLALLDLPVHPTPEDQRDRVMLELLYATGLRVSELVSVETLHMNLMWAIFASRERVRNSVSCRWANRRGSCSINMSNVARPRLVKTPALTIPVCFSPRQITHEAGVLEGAPLARSAGRH